MRWVVGALSVGVVVAVVWTGTVGVPSPARAQTSGGLAIPTVGPDPAARARAFLAARAADFDLEGLELVVDDVRFTKRSTIVRFAREVDGERVLGRSVRVRMDARGVVDAVAGDPGPRAVDPAPRTVADGDVAARATSLAPFPHATATVRRILIDFGGALARGFTVDLDGPRLTDRAAMIFDADGALLAGGPRIAHALGRVYVPNPPVAMDMTSDVELPNLTRPDRLTGRYVRASACPTVGRCDPIQTAIPDASGDYLFEPSDPAYDDPFSEVSAYFHTDRIAAYFRDVHDFTWSCCEMSTVLDVVANYTESARRPYDNAAFSPSACSSDQCGSIVLGQGPLRDYAYDGDVVYHEFTHSVVDALANIAGFDFDDLGISYEPSAINEGTADYFSATFTDSATVAEYFSGSGALGTPGALRDLANDFRCPYHLFGEGHADGRIWGGTAWSVREILGQARADALVYETLAMMSDDTDFRDAGTLLAATAEAFATDGTITGDELAQVMDVIAARGLVDCRRIVPLDDGAEHLGYSGTRFATGTVGASVAPTHYAIDIPADATRLTLAITHATAAGRYTVLVRDGQPLRFVGITVRSDAEIAVEGDEVVLDLGEPHPLPRCQTLYFGLRADDLNDARGGESVYSVRATLERSGDPDAPCPELPALDAGVGPADAGSDADAGGGEDAGPEPARGRLGGGGCQCRAARALDGRPARAHAIALLVATTIYVRRLRRARSRTTR